MSHNNSLFCVPNSNKDSKSHISCFYIDMIFLPLISLEMSAVVSKPRNALFLKNLLSKFCTLTVILREKCYFSKHRVLGSNWIHVSSPLGVEANELCIHITCNAEFLHLELMVSPWW